MENDEFQRLVLVALAEMVEAIGAMAYGDPYRSLGGRHRQVADALRVAADMGDEIKDERLRHAASR